MPRRVRAGWAFSAVDLQRLAVAFAAAGGPIAPVARRDALVREDWRL